MTVSSEPGRVSSYVNSRQEAFFLKEEEEDEEERVWNFSIKHSRACRVCAVREIVCTRLGGLSSRSVDVCLWLAAQLKETVEILVWKSKL